MSFFDRLGKAFTSVAHFENFNAKWIVDLIKADPERITQIALDPLAWTPIGSKVWGTLLGEDYEPLLNQWGGAAEGAYEAAEAEGIDTGPGRAAHSVAEVIASFYAGGYGMSQLGAGAGAATNAPPAVSGGVSGAAPGAAASAPAISAVPTGWSQAGTGGIPALTPAAPAAAAPTGFGAPLGWSRVGTGGIPALGPGAGPIPAASGGATAGGATPTTTPLTPASTPPVNTPGSTPGAITPAAGPTASPTGSVGPPAPTNTGFGSKMSGFFDWMKNNPDIVAPVLANMGSSLMAPDEGEALREMQRLRSRGYRGTDPGGSFRSASRYDRGPAPSVNIDRMYGGWEYRYDPATRRIEKVPLQQAAGGG